MPLDFVRTPEATAAREPGSLPVAPTAGEPFLLIDERDGRTVVSGAPSCTLGRETPLREGRPDGIFARWAWDGRQLQLENDRYGLQPLYYFSDNGRCALSPSVSKLIELGAPSDLDFEGSPCSCTLGTSSATRLPSAPSGPCHQSELPVVAGSPDSRGPEAAGGAGPPRPRRGSRRVRGQLPGSDPAAAAQSDDIVHLLSGGRDSRHILFELQLNGHAPRTCLTVSYGGGDTAVGASWRRRSASSTSRFPPEGWRSPRSVARRAHELLRRRAHLGLRPPIPRATAHDALRRARRGRAVRGPFPVAQAPPALRGRPLPRYRSRPLGRQRHRSDVPPGHAREARERLRPFRGSRRRSRAWPASPCP